MSTSAAQPRALAPFELRQRLYDAMRSMARYWVNETSRDTEIERMEGFCHSLLVYLDGDAGASPCGVELVCRPHPSDEAFHRERGENWVADGTVMNQSVPMHEEWHRGASAAND